MLIAYGVERSCILLLLGAAVAFASLAQSTEAEITFIGVSVPAPTAVTTLASFNGTDGDQPQLMSLVQGTDGNFYGTTPFGGASGVIEGHGVIFKMTPAGALTTVHSFDGSDGTLPYGGLVLGINGDFYGTTAGGGANSTSRCASTITGCGTIFKVTRVGTLTTLYSFDGADGGNPYSGLLQATNGDLYGTTQYGGANGAGTIFKITPAGTLTTLYDFFWGRNRPQQ